MITIYMPLLDEGTNAWRPVLAQHVTEDTFRIILDQPYDSANEHWQFRPGSMVRCREQSFADGRWLIPFELEPSLDNA